MLTNKIKISKEEYQSIKENIEWFSRFTPFEKIKIVERHKKNLRYLTSLRTKEHGA